MKLNYRDRGILLGILAVAILLLGIFLLIKPKANDIKTDNARLETVKAEWDEIETKISEIEPLQEAIRQAYKDASDLAGDFVDVTLVNETYELDQFMQPYIDECDLEVSAVDLANTNTQELSYYFFTPEVLTSSMLDAADINGNYQSAIDSVQAESNALSERTAETVMCTQYGFMAKGTKENIWNFMDKINGLNKAILIDSVNIADYTFGETARLAGDIEADDRSDVTFVINIYSVFEMDEPVVD